MRVAVALYEMVVGSVLVFAPWSAIWRQNVLLLRDWAIEPVLSSAPVRGAVSGVGAALLLCALQDMNEALDKVRAEKRVPPAGLDRE